MITDCIVSVETPGENCKPSPVQRPPTRSADLLAELYGLRPDIPAQSVTFDVPDKTFESTTGDALFTCSDIKITLVRAPLTTGGYEAYVTVSFVITSNFYQSWNPDQHNDWGAVLTWYVELFRGIGGGPLSRHESAYQLDCSSNESLFASWSINPDIFDLVDGARFCAKPSHFLRCGQREEARP